MNSADTQIPLKSVEQLADFLGVSKATVYRGCRESDPDKHWPHETIAGKFKFTASQVERILAIQAAPAPVAVQDTQVVSPARAARSARRLQAA